MKKPVLGKMITLLVIVILFATYCNAASDIKDTRPLWGVAVEGLNINENQLKDFETETGAKPKIVVFYIQWPFSYLQEEVFLPDDSIEAIKRYGAVPCITWEPMYILNGKEFMISSNSILSGKYDAYIDSFAASIGKLDIPVMVRFAHEMNINRYHWGTDKNGYGPDSPKIYRKMFGYVVSRFKKANIKNAVWIFCPNAESIPNESCDSSAVWNRAANYYPGNDVVDIIGMDGYNWGTACTQKQQGWCSSWKSFHDIFKNLFEELKIIAPGKPVVVFETASVSDGGDKTQWISNALDTARQWGITGIVWFQIKKKMDWRINAHHDKKRAIIIHDKTSYSQEFLRSPAR
ncbi:MAG: endoglucanase [Proteobacteria bacterium]|nr:endoglucanase [Pseudomonadota bacterium]